MEVPAVCLHHKEILKSHTSFQKFNTGSLCFSTAQSNQGRGAAEAELVAPQKLEPRRPGCTGQIDPSLP